MIQIDVLRDGVFRVELTDHELEVLNEAADLGSCGTKSALDSWFRFFIFNYKHLHSLERIHDELEG